MDRELKYRVWDQENHKMIYFSLEDVIFEMGSMSAGSWTMEEQIGSELARLRDIFDKAPKMQYIGFKDKQGTEVYEGDLVKAVLTDWSDEKTKEVVEQVTITDSFLAPFYMRVCFEEEWWKDHLVDGFEVIGNIWEK